MLKLYKKRPVWSENAIFAGGAFIGAPTKIAMGSSDVADGALPYDQAAAEFENWWRNDIDSDVRALRKLIWNLQTVNGPLTTTITSINRKGGIVIGTLGTNHTKRCFDSAVIAPTDFAYAGEGAAGPQFTNAGSPDDGPGQWLLTGRYTGAPTAGAFGVWLYAPDSAGVIVLAGANPYPAPTRYLVLSRGGSAYTFHGDAAFANFAEINIGGGTWINRLGGTGLKPDAANSSVMAAGRVNGSDKLCCVEFVAGVAPWRATVQDHASAGVTTVNLTAFTGIPLSMFYSVDLAAFVLLTNDGGVFTIDPINAGVVQIGAPGGVVLVRGQISDNGWLGMTATQVVASYDFENIFRLAAPATFNLFDGEAWWIADASIGATTYTRTAIVTP